MIHLKLDYDSELWPNMTAIIERHKYIRTAIWNMGWRVDNIQVYLSASKKGRHVEMDLHAVIHENKAGRFFDTSHMQAIFGSDPRREIWNISRLLSDNVDWHHDYHWNLLWEKKNWVPRKRDLKGERRLKEVWLRRGRKLPK